MSVDVHATWHDHEVLLSLSGEVDHLSAGLVGRHLDAAVTAGAAQVTVDVAGVGFIGVSGYQVLARAGRRLEDRGGQLIMVGGRPDLRRMTDIVGLRSVAALTECEARR